MRSTAVVLAVLLVAAAPNRSPLFDLDAAFRSVLEPEQARALSREKDLSVLARAFTSEQRAAVGAKLREAENTADPRALQEIHRGYLALKEAEGAWRVGDALVGRFPQAAVGYVMRGQSAELRGDMVGAAEQAREALRRNPNDRVAHALLRLSEGRTSAGSSLAPDAVQSAGSMSASGDFPAAPLSGASAEALGLMEQAVVARRDGDMARVRALAQAAMNSDPKSATVQKFYKVVEEDRRRAYRGQVGLYAAIERREADVRARREVSAELDAARRAARRHQVPPVAPLTAGGIALTLGLMLWNYQLREAAREQVKQFAAAGLIVLGCGGISYGASALFFSAPRAGPPALKFVAESATLGRAAVLQPAAETVVLVGAAGGTLGAAKTADYSFAAAETRPSGDSPSEKSAADGRAPSLEEPESLRGRSVEEIESLVPRDWLKRPMRKGSGNIFEFPGSRRSDIIEVSRGAPDSRDPLHRGPYVKISRRGKTVRIPLKGNPTLP